MRQLAVGTASCLLALLARVKGRSVERPGSEGKVGYQVVHGWPALPDGYALGQATEVDFDFQNRVWVFQLADFTRE